MSSFSIDIYDKKLGFTLDKTKINPTISKIINNGPLDKIIKFNGYNISVGSKITSIENEIIENETYDNALNIIKKYIDKDKRPINLIIQSKKLNNLISNEEYLKNSEEATKQGLKDLAYAYKESKLNNNNVLSTDSEDDNNNNIDKLEDLENKYRLLKLELLNSNIENEEKTELLNNQLNPLKELNDQLCYISNLNNRIIFINCFQNYKNISSNEMEKKYKIINEEFNCYLNECDKLINKLNLFEIKNVVQFYINNEKNNLKYFNTYYKYKINIKYIYEYFQLFSILTLILSIFIGIYYNI